MIAYRSRGRLALCLAAALLLFSNCFFSNQLGYRPQGGIKGTEVQDRIKFEVLAAYSFAILLFCNEVFNDEECRDGTASQASQGGLAASLLAADLAPVTPGKYYTAESVDKCLERMVIATDALALAHLNSKKSCSSLIATNCVVSGDDVVQAGIIAGIMAPSYCNVEEVGRIVSFHQYNL